MRLILNIFKSRCVDKGKHDFHVYLPTATEYGATFVCSKCLRQEERYIFDPIDRINARLSLMVIKSIQGSSVINPY